jgi:hypothetical protein
VRSTENIGAISEREEERGRVRKRRKKWIGMSSVALVFN